MSFGNYLAAGFLSLSGFLMLTAQEPQQAAPDQGQAPKKVKLELKVHPVAVEGGYAIVVSKKTSEDPEWTDVLKVLAAKHNNPPVIVYEKSVEEAKTKLSELMPRYTCFVGSPDEVGMDFVLKVSRMTRQLDDDPYGDTIWGIVTGYDKTGAVMLASHCDPLVTKTCVSSTGADLNAFEKCLSLSDGAKGKVAMKGIDLKYDPAEEADRSQLFAEAVNTINPDVIMSSSHATEHDLQMPFGAGGLFCKEGNLVAVDYKTKKGTQMVSLNPKVYIPAGNCLIGHIDGKNAIALAFMKSLNVGQMIGYTVPTWYGRAGHGTNDWFFAPRGMYTLAESFYINNQTIVNELETDFPGSMAVNPDNANYMIQKNPRGIDMIAMQLGYNQTNSGDAEKVKRHLGLVYDRDVLALYGDPTWDVRTDESTGKAPWTKTLRNEGNTYTFEISADKDCNAGGKVFAFLPKRVKNIKIVEGADLAPVITDNFIMVRNLKEIKAGSKIKIVFTADAI